MSAKALTRTSRILGPNGQPASQYLYPSPRHNLRKYAPRGWLAADFKSNFSSYDRIEAVNGSRQLVAQIGDLSTAIREKNSWAFGDAWDPHFAGDNKAWGEEAEEWLKNVWFPMCNVRGPQFDFKRSLFLTGVALDRDGGDLVILTENPDTHFPMFAVFPVTRIGTGSEAVRGEEVTGGPYDGAKIVDGIILNRDGRPIAVRVLGENNEKPKDIGFFRADLTFEPEWADQLIGIPRPWTCSLQWMDRQDLDSFLRAGMKRAATMQITRVSAEGESVQGNEILTGEETVSLLSGGTATREIHVERVGDGGDVIELSASEGEEIKMVDFKNPHPNSEAFVQRITRECLSSVGWFYELLNLESTGRAPSRMVCDLANQSIWARQSTGERRAKRIVRYAIAKAMKHGFLSRNDDGADPYQWEFGMPKQLSVDAGNDEQAAREALKMGMTSKAIEAQRKGYRAETIEKQRFEEIQRLCENAKKLSERFGISEDVARELLEQRSPNPVFQQPRQQPQQPKSA